MENYVYKGIFRTNSNIYDGAFFLLNSIELLLGSIFCTTHPFMKKLTTENLGRKSLLLTIEQSFFSKIEIMQWNSVINKEMFLN